MTDAGGFVRCEQLTRAEGRNTSGERPVSTGKFSQAVRLVKVDSDGKRAPLQEDDALLKTMRSSRGGRDASREPRECRGQCAGQRVEVFGRVVEVARDADPATIAPLHDRGLDPMFGPQRVL